MKKFFSTKQIYILFLIIFIIYSASILINQQLKLSSYKKQIEYYNGELENKKEKNKELSQMKENVTSPEYIEEIARDKLDMYLPNERVYIDMSK